MINLVKDGNSVVFTATEGEFPYSNGKISVPVGSIYYVIDESNIIDFKSASNGNLLTTSTIGKLSVEGVIVTKANAVEKIDAVIGATGGGSDPRVDELSGKVETLDEKIQDIELFKFPNATIIGTPLIQSGQVSRFSVDDYLQFPFIVDFKNRDFELNFSITTPSSENFSTSQYQIFDSEYGLAFAIRNKQFILAYSINGTSWENEIVATENLEPLTTYYVCIKYTEGNFGFAFNTSKEFVDWHTVTVSATPYPRTIVIGKSLLASNLSFNGSINLNDAYLTISGLPVWQGMDDAGIASRASVSLNNIDDDGEQRIKDIASTVGGGDKVKAGEGIYITEDEEGAKVISTVAPVPPSTEIWYTTTDKNVLTLNNTTDFGYSIVSNTYDGDYGVITFSGDIVKIGTSAFTNCTTLESIYFSNSVNTVGAYAFRGCSNLAMVNSLVDGELNMQKRLFGMFQSIVLGTYAFYQCPRLTSANFDRFSAQSTSLPTTLKRIISFSDGIGIITVSGSVNFDMCGNFREFNITSTAVKNVTLSDRCFYGTKINSFGSKIEGEIILDKYIKSIGKSAFYNISPIKIEIVNVIDFGTTSCFDNCEILKTVIIHPTVSINSSSLTLKQIFPNSSTPTSGVLYCDEVWFNNLTSVQRERLGNVANWTRKPLPKPLDERVYDLETSVTTLEEKVNALFTYDPDTKTLDINIVD